MILRKPHVLEKSSSEETWFLAFYKQPICWGSNVKNGLKVKQLAKEPPTLKALM